MLQKILNTLIGDPNAKTIKRLLPIVETVNQFEKQYAETLKDEDFPIKTAEFKKRLAKGETVNDLLPEAFALVKNACRRLIGKKWTVRGREITWDMIPYDVQIIGGIVLHQGKIAEMKTGEGKTLVCTMPVYLNALTEQGVFVVTVNEYLAERDAEWMSGLYQFLGLSVGTILHAQNPKQKQEIYRYDIIYGTNNEFGFDYLRDNMATSLENIVQRNLNYAIIDEVDSILIDEARTPLIISAPAEESTAKYQRYARLIQNLKENEDYNIDEKVKTATLTEAGIAKMEQLMGVENIYTSAGFLEVHHLEQALKASACYKLDVDYVVKDDEVIIVDEFTGRIMPGRRYSEGLHQAIEAKEGVEVKRESKTLATVSLQNYFRLFKKLGGMTGTAMTEAEEFYKIYRLDTVEIPTNMRCIREDRSDVIYKTMKAKFLAVTEKVKELHEKGQPVLIGTISIEKSEMLSQLLSMKGVPHNVLNAKQHEREAEIVANAGQKGAVTIATNMAGRGTDIKLGEGVKEVGGLCIIGTERHESRRIDNQLRGRSGRQGDPGKSMFYVSLEDELMRLFGSEKVQKMMDRLGIPDDMPIENAMISNSIESAQKRVEGRNFDVRKHLVDYDDVMNKHREIIYSRRRKMLKNTDTQKDVAEMFAEEAKNIVLLHSSAEHRAEWNIKEIVETVRTIHVDAKNPLTNEELSKLETREEMIEKTAEYLKREYENREKEIEDPVLMRCVERNVCLHVIDSLWMEHIDEMSHLRENVALQGYGQRDPLIEYKSEAFTMLAHLLSAIRANTINTLFKVDLEKEAARKLLIQTAREMQTNENEIEGVLSGEKSGAVTRQNPTVIRLSADENSSGGQAIWATGESHAPISHAKAGRNDPCPCGSGKKYKKCHGK